MKRKALGLLLFLLIVPLFMGCDQAAEATTVVTTVATTEVTTVTTTTTEATTVATTTTEAALGTVTFEIFTAGDDSATTEVETEYVTNSVSIEYYEDDTLFELLLSNFTVTYETSIYGQYLTGIDTLVLAETNEYISFYIDGDYAMTGVDVTELVDGTVYSFSISIGTF